MAPFDPVSALIGGALIGLAAVLLMLLNGRIAGVSGILGEALTGPVIAGACLISVGILLVTLAPRLASRRIATRFPQGALHGSTDIGGITKS